MILGIPMTEFMALAIVAVLVVGLMYFFVKGAWH
jgi:uncharacterized protein YjeT (DUF2065 family)